MNDSELKTLQTTILLLDDVSKLEIMRLDLLPYLKKAEEIKKLMSLRN